MKSITRVLDVHLLPVDGYRMPENRIFALESPFLSLFLYTYILFLYISLYFFCHESVEEGDFVVLELEDSKFEI